MTDKKITDLSSASAISAADVIPIVQNTTSTPVTRKIAASTLFTNIPTSTTITGSLVVTDKTDISGSLTVAGNTAITGSLAVTGILSWKAQSTLTISGSAITITGNVHSLDTEGGVATGSLVTINGGVVGQILVLRTINASHDVIVRDGTGNIYLAGDMTLDNTLDTLTLINPSGGGWIELCRSNNA